MSVRDEILKIHKVAQPCDECINCTRCECTTDAVISIIDKAIQECSIFMNTDEILLISINELRSKLREVK